MENDNGPGASLVEWSHVVQQASSLGLFSSVGPPVGVRLPPAFFSKVTAVQEKTIGELTPVVIADEGS